ncbi:MAG: hypothetical protein AMJ94_10120 [Deltaproteobacteria bacterium SM23_61]|nr:MAG: hypothetical protein AMJ94_10120 [Deltaproteobacteria bacterium SM23_61]
MKSKIKCLTGEKNLQISSKGSEEFFLLFQIPKYFICAGKSNGDSLRKARFDANEERQNQNSAFRIPNSAFFFPAPYTLPAIPFSLGLC